MSNSIGKSRGRPRQAVAEENEMRSRIVTVARELFLREGVAAVSMRNIASEVGCSPMWIYRYFDGKQEILWNVWDVFLLELMARLNRIRAKTPIERLEKIALGYLNYWMENPDRFLIVFLQEDLVPGATRAYLEKSDSLKSFEMIVQAVRAAQTAGQLGGPDATKVAHGLFCVMQGLAMNFITIPEFPWSDTKDIARITVRGYLAGMEKLEE